MQIIDQRETDKSRFFAITGFYDCIIEDRSIDHVFHTRKPLVQIINFVYGKTICRRKWPWKEITFSLIAWALMLLFTLFLGLNVIYFIAEPPHAPLIAKRYRCEKIWLGRLVSICLVVFKGQGKKRIWHLSRYVFKRKCLYL